MSGDKSPQCEWILTYYKILLNIQILIDMSDSCTSYTLLAQDTS